MPFKTGDPNINRKGRPKRGEEKSTSELRREWRRILEEETPHFKERLKETKGLSYWKAIDILATRALPALQSIEIDQDLELKELFTMSPEERQEKIKELQTQFNAT